MNQFCMKNLLPNKSLFGFSILNSSQSIIFSYTFIVFSFFVTPLFGVENYQLISGSFFILLINISTIILIANSFLQKRKYSFYWWLAFAPLSLYFPYSIVKISHEINILLSFLHN